MRASAPLALALALALPGFAHAECVGYPAGATPAADQALATEGLAAAPAVEGGLAIWPAAMGARLNRASGVTLHFADGGRCRVVLPLGGERGLRVDTGGAAPLWIEAALCPGGDHCAPARVVWVGGAR